MLPVILFVVAIIAAIIHLSCRKKHRTSAKVVEVFLGYMIPLNIGAMGIICYIANAFYATETAAMMHWPVGGPFQLQMAMASLGLGIVGILSIWLRKGFWLATVLVDVIFLFGCAWVHIAFMMMQQQMGNMETMMHGGLWLYTNDLIIPIIMLVLTLVYAGQHKFFRKD